jgi:ubiquinone/menaquinone biosynthesis C-methylase UbiE
MSELHTRQPHAVLDLTSRQLKAIKIERLLGLDVSTGAIRLLEIGVGSGGISHYFGTHVSERYQVNAVDVVDSRVVCEGYTFTQVNGTELPFESEHFDVVISNHVIEHVGDDDAQAKHLLELKRVMKPNGIAYLAVPNRWMLIEPHYKLIFLSWWPVSWRSKYLQIFTEYKYYDCKPLEMHELESKLKSAKLGFENISVKALRVIFEIEGKNGVLQKIAASLPDWILGCMNRIMPTLIYKLSKKII